MSDNVTPISEGTIQIEKLARNYLEARAISWESAIDIKKLLRSTGH
jgi:hypothetical protein